MEPPSQSAWAQGRDGLDLPGAGSQGGDLLLRPAARCCCVVLPRGAATWCCHLVLPHGAPTWCFHKSALWQEHCSVPTVMTCPRQPVALPQGCHLLLKSPLLGVLVHDLPPAGQRGDSRCSRGHAPWGSSGGSPPGPGAGGRGEGLAPVNGHPVGDPFLSPGMAPATGALLGNHSSTSC